MCKNVYIQDRNHLLHGDQQPQPYIATIICTRLVPPAQIPYVKNVYRRNISLLIGRLVGRSIAIFSKQLRFQDRSSIHLFIHVYVSRDEQHLFSNLFRGLIGESEREIGKKLQLSYQLEQAI